MELTTQERDQLAKAAIDWVLKYFSAQSTLPVYPTVSARELSSRLAGSLPLEPQDPAAHHVGNAAHRRR